MKHILKKISAAALSAIMVLSFFLLSGCGSLFDIGVQDIAFVSDGKTITYTELTLGDKLDIDKIVSVTPSYATNKDYAVKSDNTEAVKIEKQTSGGVSRLYASAVGVGTARLTAVSEEGGKTASLTVKVSYAKPDSVTVSVASEVTTIKNSVILGLQDIGAPVLFSAILNKNTSPKTIIEWSVSGGEVVTKSADENFEFTPNAVGKYAVTAAVQGDGGGKYSDTLDVCVYGEISGKAVEYSGELEQKAENCTPVTFTMLYDFTQGEPEPITQWFVNGAASGYGNEFVYCPSSPGLHEIEGKLNGELIKKISVRVSGTVTPQNVYVDFDNCYPQIWVRWDCIPAKVDYELSIVDLSTGREVSSNINSRNNALKDKFTDSGFDASDYITDIFTTSYAVKVKTLGDGNLLGESGFSNVFQTSKVPSRAESYLNSKFYDGARNRYISSYEEFYEWFEYAMLWRTDSVQSGERLYLAYSYTSAISELDKAMNSQHFTGSYMYGASDSGRNKGECTFTIEFQTDGSPSRRTNAPHTGEAWNAMRPHVNYDESKARPAKYEFPIDGKTPVTVETSDQLYYIAQLGYKPVPAAASSAERLYNYARRTLRYIITDDMTDVQKLHAIYDWVMWRNIYDYEVLEYTSLSAAVKYEAYYMESIFSDSNNYGVCDAMSKAFSLMCSIEGFECVRVTGTAGNGRDSGGHAWNKVKLYGQWYIVDCTWGDVSVQLMPGGSAREAASHMYFLLSDSDVDETHFEDEGVYFPATATKRYPWYEESLQFGNDEVDLYLESALTLTAFRSEMNTLVSYMLFCRDNAEDSYRVGADEVNRTATQYFAFEFVSAARWGDSEISTLRSALESGLSSHKLTYGKDYYLVMSRQGLEVHTMVFFR